MSSKVAKIDHILKYIEETGKISPRYTLLVSEVNLLFQEGPFDGILLAFQYGMAKGYRAAKAEAKKC